MTWILDEERLRIDRKPDPNIATRVVGAYYTQGALDALCLNRHVETGSSTAYFDRNSYHLPSPFPDEPAPGVSERFYLHHRRQALRDRYGKRYGNAKNANFLKYLSCRARVPLRPLLSRSLPSGRPSYR